MITSLVSAITLLLTVVAGVHPGGQPTVAVAPPPGFRYVGIGHVAIAVPTAWRDGFVSCGGDRTGIVTIDLPGTRLCEGADPTIANVIVEPALGVDTSSWTEDSNYVLHEPTTCRGRGGQHECHGGAAYGEGEDGVVFLAVSPRGKAYVDRVLSRIAVLDDDLAVPGWQVPQAVSGGYASAYLALLTADGFRVVHREVRGAPGRVVSVRPVVGTMLAPGATVTATTTGRGVDDARTGFQYVGIGRAVIAAPAAWPLGHHQCVDDGVVLDQIGPPDCLPPRRKHAGSIAVVPFYPGETYSHAHPGTIDGVRVYYTEMTSAMDVAGTSAWFEQAYVPAYRGVFDVESTRSPAHVRRLLAGLHILRHRVAVPFAYSSPGQPSQTVGQLLRRIRALGLHADLRLAPGTNRGSPVAAVSPPGGTLADPGSVITVVTNPPPH